MFKRALKTSSVVLDGVASSSAGFHKIVSGGLRFLPAFCFPKFNVSSADSSVLVLAT